MRLTPFIPRFAFAALMFLLFVLNTPALKAQERTPSVKGLVTNNNGDPISGVNQTLSGYNIKENASLSLVVRPGSSRWLWYAAKKRPDR